MEAYMLWIKSYFELKCVRIKRESPVRPSMGTTNNHSTRNKIAGRANPTIYESEKRRNSGVETQRARFWICSSNREEKKMSTNALQINFTLGEERFIVFVFADEITTENMYLVRGRLLGQLSFLPKLGKTFWKVKSSHRHKLLVLKKLYKGSFSLNDIFSDPEAIEHFQSNLKSVNHFDIFKKKLIKVVVSAICLQNTTDDIPAQWSIKENISQLKTLPKQINQKQARF